MSEGDRQLPFPRRHLGGAPGQPLPAECLLDSEWLLTNGAGGYASGTVAGVATRRYHGLLVAALPVHGRTVMLSHLYEELRVPAGDTLHLGGEDRDGHTVPVLPPVDFCLELGLPLWRYELPGAVLEKRVLMPWGQNTVHVGYRLLSGGPLRLRLHPGLAFRPHDAPFEESLPAPYELVATHGGRYSVHSGAFPPLRLRLDGVQGSFVVHWDEATRLHHRLEADRGYRPVSALLRPGCFQVELSAAAPQATLIASTESWSAIDQVPPVTAREVETERRRQLLARVPAAQDDVVTAELVLAADQFVVAPAWRVHELARGQAAGQRLRSIIAGYHWFTDWGRDTMIALEGLTLLTGRAAEARDILRAFAEHVRDGLIPNYFPEGREEGLYHTADATLWFFHALDRYLEHSGDESLLRELLPRLAGIVAAHRTGTRYGIGVDPADGLLCQGAPGVPLTWMDAKVADWVVTPRRGKAVEINGLWYNALRLLQHWQDAAGARAEAAKLCREADRVHDAFNQRFWYAAGGHLYDVVDGERGDDPAFRPNQLFAFCLRHPVLAPARWAGLLDQIRARLLTPVGLRSLAPGHPDYKQRYFGDVRARDAAYHQGTVWAWLIGPYLDAWLRVHPGDRAGARAALSGLVDHLGDACLGSVSEIFDAEAPYTARGCVAQAWSVAELLRSWRKTAAAAD